MILRRFMEHIRDQNWFAVGLDVLVVIVGIFLGMQVTDWNEVRKQEEALERYYALLILDLQRERNEQKIFIEYHERTRDFARSALKTLEGGLPVDRTTLVDLFQATHTYRPGLYRTAYQEFISLGLQVRVSDQQLKEFLSFYYAPVVGGDIFSMLETSYRHRLRATFLQNLKDRLYFDCNDKVVIDKNGIIIELALPEHCDVEIADEMLDRQRVELANYSDLVMDLRHHTSVINMVLMSAATNVELADKLIALLKKTD